MAESLSNLRLADQLDGKITSMHFIKCENVHSIMVGIQSNCCYNVSYLFRSYCLTNSWVMSIVGLDRVVATHITPGSSCKNITMIKKGFGTN